MLILLKVFCKQVFVQIPTHADLIDMGTAHSHAMKGALAQSSKNEHARISYISKTSKGAP